MRYTYFGIGHPAMLRKIARDCLAGSDMMANQDVNGDNQEDDDDDEEIGDVEDYDERDDGQEGSDDEDDEADSYQVQALREYRWMRRRD